MSRLFRNDIPPSCSTCAHAVRLTDTEMLCRRCGAVSEGYRCRRYRYDPLKRVPQRTPPLPKGDGLSLE